MATPITGNLGSVQAAVSYPTDAAGAYGAVGIQVVTGLTGTIAFEATIDGQNWFAVAAMPMAGGAAVTTVANPATAAWLIPVFGYGAIRVRCSAYTSGTAVVVLDAAASDLGAFGASSLLPAGGGMVDSLVFEGHATAPTAAADILAAQTPGVAGTYQVQVFCSVSTSGVIIDSDNIEFMKDGVLFLKLANSAPGASQFNFRMTITAATTIGTKAIGNATATVVYATTVVMTRVA